MEKKFLFIVKCVIKLKKKNVSWIVQKIKKMIQVLENILQIKQIMMNKNVVNVELGELNIFL